MGAIVEAVGGFFAHGAQKKQTKKTIADYQGARDNALSAYGGARDAAVGAYQPFYEGGADQFNQAQNMLSGDFQYSPSDPSYNWRFGEGMRAVQQSAAANGSLNSGGTLKALTRYGQGMASTEFGADFARRNLLAGYGMQGANGIAAAQSLYGQNAGKAYFDAADGMSDARRDRGEAIASQWGDGAQLVNGVGKLFGLGGF